METLDTDNHDGPEHVDLLLLCTPPDNWITVQPGPVDQGALEKLTTRGFDQAPVLRPNRDDPIGLVTVAHLRDLLGRHEHLSENDPVVKEPGHFVHTMDKVDVELPFAWLHDRQAVLVDWSASGWSPSVGLLTIADLNEHALRGPLYALLSSLELQLSKLVDNSFKDPWDWLGALSEEHQVRILGFWELSRKKGVDVGALAATTLPQLLNIVARRKDLLAMLGLRSRVEFESRTGKFAELRNAVMHPVRPLILQPDDVGQVLRSVRTAKELRRTLSEDMSSTRTKQH